MSREEPELTREEFVEEFTPYDDWEEFMKARANYKNEGKDNSAS